MPGDDRFPPPVECAAHRPHLDGPVTVGHVGDQLVDELTGEQGVGDLIELADGLLGPPGGLNITSGISGAQDPEHLVPTLCVESLSRHRQPASDPEQRVVLPAPVPERLVLDPPAALVELGGHVADHVELVGHQPGIGQHLVEHMAIGGGQVEGARADSSAPLSPLPLDPALGLFAPAIRDQVEQLSPFHVDQCGHEVLDAPLARLHEEVLVEPEGVDRAESVGMVDQGRAEREHGVVDGVPVATEHGRHLVDGPTVLTDLDRRPSSGSVGQSQSRPGDPLIDLGPRTHRAGLLRTAPPALVPMEADRRTEGREVDEGHDSPPLERGHRATRMAAVDRGVGLNVQFDRVVGMADRAEHRHVGETDEQLVDLGRISLERRGELAKLGHRPTVPSAPHARVDPSPRQIRSATKVPLVMTFWASPRWSLERWNRPRIPGLIACLSGVVFVLARWAGAAHRQISQFILLGHPSTNPAYAPHGVVVLPGPGYDGQFYYRLAMAPWNFSNHAFGITIDSPIRIQRIGYPVLAWLGSAGTHQLVPYSLVVANLLALGALGWLSGRWAQQLGRHALWGLLPATFFGFVYTLSRDLTEILAAACLVGALVAIRSDRFVLAGITLSAAVLTRETVLLFIASYGALRCLSLLRRRDQVGKKDAVWVTPLLVFGIWQVVVRLDVGGWPITSDKSSNFDVPFRGIVDMLPVLRHASTNTIALMTISGIALVLMAISALAVLRQTNATDAECLAFILAFLVVLSLSANVWNGDPLEFRTFSDLWIYGTGILIGSRRTTLLALTAVSGGFCTGAIALWKIVTI